MPQIPLSQRTQQAGVVSQPRASASAAAAPWQAVAQAGRTAMQVSGQIAAHQKQKQAFRKEKERVEQEAIKQEMMGKIALSKAEYEAGLLGRKDYNAMGNLDASVGPMDQQLADFNRSMKDMLASDERLKKYPELLESLYGDVAENTSYASISGKKSGAKQLKDYGMAVADTNVDAAVRAMDYELARSVVEDGRGTLYSDIEADEKLKEIPSRIARRGFDIVYAQNPKRAMDLLDDGAYDTIAITSINKSGKVVEEKISSGLTTEDKRSMRAWAKSALSDNQIAASNEIAMPDSDYSKLSADDKLQWLDDQVKKENISISTYKQERDLVMVPRFVDQTTEHRNSLLNYSMALRKTGGDKEKIAEILNKAMAEKLPREFKEALNKLGTDILDPKSSYNKPKFQHARDLLDAGFKRVDMVPEESGLIRKTAAITGLVKATPRGFAEARDALVINAEFSARESVNKWLATDGADATDQQVAAYVSSTIIDTKEQYGIPLLPERMAEIIQRDQITEQTIEEGINLPEGDTTAQEFDPATAPVGTERADDSGTIWVKREDGQWESK